VEKGLIVVDAGPLYAYIHHDDQHHIAALDFISGYSGKLYVPVLVVPEVVHFISSRINSQVEVLFLADLASDDFTI
jgi:predicted nucleic acid-binding protein